MDQEALEFYFEPISKSANLQLNATNLVAGNRIFKSRRQYRKAMEAIARKEERREKNKKRKDDCEMVIY